MDPGTMSAAESSESNAKASAGCEGPRCESPRATPKKSSKAIAYAPIAVALQQLTRRGASASAGDAPRVGAEQRVAECQAAEEERQHAGRRLGVRAEQRAQHALPRHLVDEAGRARGDGEEQGERARHGGALYPKARRCGAECAKGAHAECA
jgi:hypothetical protein